MIPDEIITFLLEFFSLRAASPGTDFIIGSPLNIFITDPNNPILGDLLIGRTGSDTLIGVDPAADVPGAGEIDILVGGPGPVEPFDGTGTTIGPDADRFVLGDANTAYYSGAGFLDFALIADFNLDEDTIQLNGSADDYSLFQFTIPGFDTTITTLSLSSDTTEIVGIVLSPTALDLNADYFAYVDTPPPADPAFPAITQFGTPGLDFAFDIATDSNGNAYAVGGTSRTLTGANVGANDIFITKYDDQGNEIFVQQFGSPAPETAFSVEVGGGDNFFVSGVTFGSLAGSNAGFTDAWVGKFNSEGDSIWLEQFGSDDRDNSFSGSLAVDTDGNVIQGGYTLGDLGGPNAGEDSTDPWVTKFDNDGNQLWIEQFGTATYDELFGVTTDLDNNIYLTGWTVGNLGGTNAGLYDTWLAKYDGDGNQIWIEQFGTGDYEFPAGVATDSEGNVYSTGYTLGNLGGGSSGSYDVWVTKYDGDGNQLWLEQFGSGGADEPQSIDIDADDNIFVTGFTTGALAGSNAGQEDAWVAKLDTGGTLLELEQYGSAGIDRAQGIASTDSGDVFLAGLTDNSLGAENAGSFDAWVAQVSASDLSLV